MNVVTMLCNCYNCGFAVFDRTFGEFMCFFRKMYIYQPSIQCVWWTPREQEKKEE